MLDPQLLRNNAEEVARVLRPRGYLLDVERFQDLEKDRKQLQINQQQLQHSRNQNSKEIGKLKAAKGGNSNPSATACNRFSLNSMT